MHLFEYLEVFKTYGEGRKKVLVFKTYGNCFCGTTDLCQDESQREISSLTTSHNSCHFMLKGESLQKSPQCSSGARDSFTFGGREGE